MLAHASRALVINHLCAKRIRLSVTHMDRQGIHDYLSALGFEKEAAQMMPEVSQAAEFVESLRLNIDIETRIYPTFEIEYHIEDVKNFANQPK